MAKNYSGRDYLLYAGVTVPTSAVDSGDAAYDLVGLQTSFNLTRSRNAMDKSNKDDGDESSFVAGRRNWSVSGSVVYDHTIDAGQAHFDTAWAAGNGTVYFLSTTDEAGDKEFAGSGILTDWSVTTDDEGVSTGSFTIQGTGALTAATVA